MGSCVHDALELLYRDLMKTKLNTLEDLIKFYESTWQTEWSDEIAIGNPNYNKEHYFNLGKKCVENYYQRYYPFDQDQTIGVEKNIKLKWGEYEVTGYIDRLAREVKGVYSIHDYKTGFMMEQDYADKDRQLALYSIAVKQNYKEAKEVKLVWHYVAYGEDVISRRTDKDLAALKDKILGLIKEMNIAEQEDNFPARETKCDWCGYWQHCPKKKHLFKIQKLPKNKYLNESGVKLANKYIKLAEQKSGINRQSRIKALVVAEEMEKVKQAILEYAKKHEIEALNGDGSLVAINKTKDYSFPTKSSDPERYNELENLLKGTKYWNDISVVNAAKLDQLLASDVFDNRLKNEIIKLAPLEEEISLSIKKIK